MGSFGKGALEHQFVRGFKVNGWKITCLDIQENIYNSKNKSLATKVLFHLNQDFFLKPTNEKVIGYAQKLKPQVILIFKGMELWPDTINELKAHCELLCNYNPDHPFDFFSKGSGNKNVKESIQKFDIYFSYSQVICKKLVQKFNTNSYCIPFGYDETIVSAKKDMPNISNQILFIGAYDKERERKLKILSDIPIQIFGPGIWQKKIDNFKALKYQPESLYEQSYANACLNSDGVLNFLRPQNIIEQSHNMRTFEVPGYGGLLIAERTEEQLAFFEENKEAIYFENLEELKDKLNFLSNNYSVINTLKHKAYQRAMNSHYSYFYRSKELIKVISSQI